MSSRITPSKGKGSRPGPGKDRRAASTEGTPATLRQLKGLLGRPIRLERRDGRLQMVLVERRRAPASIPPPVAELRAELRARWLARNDGGTSHAMEQLAFVHDELGRTGWAGVGELSSDLLSDAREQAQMLAGEKPSPAFVAIVQQLDRLQAKADLREGRQARLAGSGANGDLEVSEATHEEFEEMARSWVGSVPTPADRNS